MEKGLFWSTQEKMEAGGNGEVGQRREKVKQRPAKGSLGPVLQKVLETM